MTYRRVRLALCLTHRCDLACPYCYAGRARAVDMPLATARRAVAFALDWTSPGGRLTVGFFGGEPLLAWSTIEILADEIPVAAAARGIDVDFVLTTSGTHLTPARFDRLAAAGSRLTVSLDGLPEVHDRQRPGPVGRGSFDRVAGRLAELGPERVARLAANMVVTPASAGLLDAGIETILGLGIESIEINIDYHAEWPDAAREALGAAARRAADDHVGRRRAGGDDRISWIDSALSAVLAGGYPAAARCGYGAGEFAVAPSGRVYPCERLIGPDTDAAASLGDLDDFAPPPGAEAPSCSTGPFCLSWCRCNNRIRTGDPDRPDDLIHLVCRLQLEMAARVAAGLELVAAHP